MYKNAVNLTSTLCFDIVMMLVVGVVVIVATSARLSAHESQLAKIIIISVKLVYNGCYIITHDCVNLK